jgi:hypothetical protein
MGAVAGRFWDKSFAGFLRLEGVVRPIGVGSSQFAVGFGDILRLAE